MKLTGSNKISRPLRVIPAKAGIHTPRPWEIVDKLQPELRRKGLWIPAYAGMTPGTYKQSH